VLRQRAPRPGLAGTTHGQGAFAVTLPVPPGPVAEIVQLSPPAPIAKAVVPVHGSEPLPTALPVQSKVHAVAFLQSQDTFEVALQLSNEPVQIGGKHVAVVVAVAVPPVPTPVMVQVSPAAPTANGVEPEHAIEPPADAVPEHAYEQLVASVHDQLIVEVSPQPLIVAEQAGFPAQAAFAVAAVEPAGPVAWSVQCSPALPTIRSTEPLHAIAPEAVVVPVQS
jgi:hypothetical protein